MYDVNNHSMNCIRNILYTAQIHLPEQRYKYTIIKNRYSKQTTTVQNIKLYKRKNILYVKPKSFSIVRSVEMFKT